MNVEKNVLENPDVVILIECSGDEIDFELFIADEMVYDKKSLNIFHIANFSYKIKAN